MDLGTGALAVRRHREGLTFLSGLLLKLSREKPRHSHQGGAVASIPDAAENPHQFRDVIRWFRVALGVGWEDVGRG